MTQELEATASPARDKLLTTELVPEQVLPKVMTTFGLTATYVFIICWITGSSIMAAGGWTAIPMWVLGILTFLVPAGMAVAELGRSSVRYLIGVFADGANQAAAHGEFVHVLVDRRTRRPVEIPDDWRTALQSIS